MTKAGPVYASPVSDCIQLSAVTSTQHWRHAHSIISCIIYYHCLTSTCFTVFTYIFVLYFVQDGCKSFIALSLVLMYCHICHIICILWANKMMMMMMMHDDGDRCLKQVSSAAEEPARRAMSRVQCCTQRCTLSVINRRRLVVELNWQQVRRLTCCGEIFLSPEFGTKF